MIAIMLTSLSMMLAFKSFGTQIIFAVYTPIYVLDSAKFPNCDIRYHLFIFDIIYSDTIFFFNFYPNVIIHISIALLKLMQNFDKLCFRPETRYKDDQRAKG